MEIFLLKPREENRGSITKSMNRDGGFLGDILWSVLNQIGAVPFEPPTFADMPNAWPNIASSNEEVRACMSWHFYYPLDDDISGGSARDLLIIYKSDLSMVYDSYFE